MTMSAPSPNSLPFLNTIYDANKFYGDLRSQVNNHIFGQNNAIDVVLQTFKRYLVGLNEPNKPIGAFLFVGPTGSGKSQTAKVLAEHAFGKEGLIKIDCSEYAQEFMATRLIGAPPGYIGHENGSVLIRMMQQRKDKGTIILFDEVEKAHPTFFDLFLQILDEAVLTDGSGTQADFSKSIIIMTSNIGSKNYSNNQTLGFRNNNRIVDIEKSVNKEIKALLRPELINRLTAMLYFKPLTEVEIKLILGKYFKELNKKLQRLEIKLEPSDEVIEHLIKIGFNPEYNARELYRVFTRYIINPMSDIILAGDLKSDSLVLIKLSPSTIGSSPKLLLKRIGSYPLLDDGEEEV